LYRFNERVCFCLYFQTQIVCHPRIGSCPFLIAVWASLAPDLTPASVGRAQQPIGRGIEGSMDYPAVSRECRMGVIAARFLVQIGASVKQAAAQQKSLTRGQTRPSGRVSAA
jgi:hypothetical protein